MLHKVLIVIIISFTTFVPFVTKAITIGYDIIYVKQPRNGDDSHIIWPEVFQPGRVEANSDLILLHPDGSEEILVDTENGAVMDPFVSFDAKWVYYSLFYDVRNAALNYQRGHLPYAGADIFRINLKTRKKEQLTFQEFTPNTGTGNWDESNPVNPESGYNYLKYGIINTGPAPIAGNKIVFTSNRTGFRPTKGFTYPTMQLYVMDEDGSNVTPISPMTLGSALHPTPMANGRIMFSSYESQGLRDGRLWGLWSIAPDGRDWQPLISAFKPVSALHFSTQLSDKSVIIEDYYNLNNFGFGALYRIPEPPKNGPAFYSAILSDNPQIETSGGNVSMAFTPKGMHSITPLSGANDAGAENGSGKYTHPSAAPNNDLLVVWSDGPVNKLHRPTDMPAVDSGIYIISGSKTVRDQSQLHLIKNDPLYNEVWPRAVVPYKAIHEIVEPVELPWLPNNGDKHDLLPKGTAYGLIGSSSFYNRESFPGRTRGTDNFDGLDSFNTTINGQSVNWNTQGADAGRYSNEDIWAVRVLAMEGNPDRGYGPNSSPNGGRFFYNHANERLRILGEIPLRKFNTDGSPILDITGEPDTSFLAKIPADTPYTFQTLDKNGMVLNMSQTWHQVRPGEIRNDCGGCHAHSSTPVDFENTAAAKDEYEVWDLSVNTPLISQTEEGDSILNIVNEPIVNVEFYQDIKPILNEHCTSCHTKENENPPANLVLDDTTIYNGFPGDYKRLCNDPNADFGIPPLIFAWRQTNASRYVRKFQSRRSLLMWKIFGERLDGWSNEDHPSATTLGDVNSLPENTNINDTDLDFIGSIMPIPGQGINALSIDEKMTFARWIDLGCPIDTASGTTNEGYGWFADEQRPALTVTSPTAGDNISPITEIVIGFADAYTGINSESLSIKANINVNGVPAGEELKALFEPTSTGVYRLAITDPTFDNIRGTIFVAIADNQGNITRIKRKFSVGTPTNTPIKLPEDDAENNDVSDNDNSDNNSSDIEITYPPGSIFINFTSDNVLSLDETQDKANSGEFSISVSGEGISLTGNLWKFIPQNITVEQNTVLQFEYKSTQIGEVQAIGLVASDDLNAFHNFQVYGTQSWGYQHFHQYISPSTWVKYSIPIGQYFTGAFIGLNLINDQDIINPTANSQFKNIVIYQRD